MTRHAYRLGWLDAGLFLCYCLDGDRRVEETGTEWNEVEEKEGGGERGGRGRFEGG